jgi:flagellar biosynthesis anti-sigma factor FlgM
MTVNNNDNPDITRLNLEQTSLQKTQGSSRAGDGNTSETGSAPGVDSISLSNVPNYVQQALTSSSSARAARIQELKALVANGQYQPDAQIVSSALIDAHLQGA